MGMNWRQLLLVVLVAAIVGGASGFVGDQVSVRWFNEATLGSPPVTLSIPRVQWGQVDREYIECEIFESEQRMKVLLNRLAGEAGVLRAMGRNPSNNLYSPQMELTADGRHTQLVTRPPC